MSDLGSRAIVMAALLACHDKPTNGLVARSRRGALPSSGLDGRGECPPWDGQLRNGPAIGVACTQASSQSRFSPSVEV